MTTHKEQLPISVIIPAYNEEAAIRAQIEKIQYILGMSRMLYEIVIVDDGSEDNTANAALATGVKVLKHSTNKGYGAALKTGIMSAQHDVIVIIDADGTYPAAQIPEMVNKLESADMVVGARIGEHVRVPLVRRPAKYLLQCLASFIADQPIIDLNSGLRVFRRSCIQQYFPILSNKFSFTTTSTLAFLADGYRIVYHPIDYYQRIGKSKIVPRNFIDFIILILRITMLFQPLKVFAPLAFLAGLLGVLKLSFDIVILLSRHPTIDITILYGPVVSTSTILLLFISLQVLLIGMIADGIIRRVGQHVAKPLVLSHGIDYIELSTELSAKLSADKTSHHKPSITQTYGAGFEAEQASKGGQIESL